MMIYDDEGSHTTKLMVMTFDTLYPLLIIYAGAGKTTLMDVLAGRKTAGTMTGDILVNGYPKNQKTFSRIMGCKSYLRYVDGSITPDEISQVMETHDE